MTKVGPRFTLLDERLAGHAGVVGSTGVFLGIADTEKQLVFALCKI